MCGRHTDTSERAFLIHPSLLLLCATRGLMPPPLAPLSLAVLTRFVLFCFIHSSGEIIPQAVCSRYGLLVGAYSAWFVNLLMIITLLLSWPIAKLLDLLLGSEHSVRGDRTTI